MRAGHKTSLLLHKKGKKIDTQFAVHVPAELIRNSTKNMFTSPAAGQAAIEKR
jgi:hypothetical protein